MKSVNILIILTNCVFVANLVNSYPYFPTCTSIDSNSFVLNTLNGKVKGSCNNVSVNYVSKPKTASPILYFLGIPYAQPPVGKLRFKNALPVNSWANTLDGTKPPNRCFQIDPLGTRHLHNVSEDCLQLNVYVPYDIFLNAVTLKNESFKAPVYVYIHGGAFAVGASIEETHEPSTFVAMSNVIVVNINYRLGIFGYLYANGTDSRGNQGILDQSLALKWIFENAHTFGGDNSKITIGGQSAGAFSVAMHLVYKPSWPYFSSAIIQSGTLPYTKCISTTEATRRLNGVSLISNCSKSTNEKTLDCLRTIEPNLLAKLSIEYFDLNNWPLIVFDEITIKKQPSDSFAQGEFKNANLLIGSNTKEFGISFAPKGLTPISLENEASLAGILMFSFPGNQKLVNEIIDFYVKPLNKTQLAHNHVDVYVDHLIEIIGDSNFVIPSIQLAEYQSKKNSNVFAYSYAYHIGSSGFESKYEAVHSEEMFMVFGEPLSVKSSPLLNTGIYTGYSSLHHNYSVADCKVSEQMMNYWSNFIKNNNPSLTSGEWPMFNSQTDKLSRKIMLLNGSRSMASHFKLNDPKYLFWTNDNN